MEAALWIWVVAGSVEMNNIAAASGRQALYIATDSDKKIIRQKEIVNDWGHPGSSRRAALNL